MSAVLVTISITVSSHIPYIRQHLSYNDCLEDKTEDVFCAVTVYHECNVQSYEQFLRVNCFRFSFVSVFCVLGPVYLSQG